MPRSAAAEVPPALHHQHVELLLDQRDERQERIAPRLALEQIVRRVLKVATTITPRSNSAWNSRPRIIASAMSFTWNSSKHSSAASVAIKSASGGIGSSISGWARLNAWKRMWTFCMKRWKWMRCLRATRGGEEQVHQHGLAAAHLADEVEAVGPVLAAFSVGLRRSRRPSSGLRWLPGAAAGRSRAV